MNFSNNRGLTRIVSLSIAVLMMTGIFSGCGKDNGSESTSSEPSISLNLSETSDTSEETTVPPTTSEPIVYNENMGTVTNEIYVRVIPSKDANSTGTLEAGTIVEILRQDSVAGVNWGMISTPVSGWIMMDYVDMFSSEEGSVPSETTDTETNNTNTGAETGAETQNIKGVITGNGVNVRDEASTAGKIVGSYNKGDVVTILETKGDWGRTSKGWVSMKYVNTTGTNTSTNTNANTNTNTNTTTNTGNGSTAVVARGIVTAGSGLNVRSTAGTDGERVGNLSYGTRVEILEKSGEWGRIKDGWINLNYVYQDGTTGSKTAKGIVTVNGLNIRTGPGTKYDTAGSYSSGERVSILEQFTYGDTTWGCTSKGWISMGYVYVDGTDIGKSVNGTVTTDNLNIRSGPGTGYDSVGKLNTNDAVTILYQLEVGDTTWGCTSKGWISMSYVNVNQ